MKAAIAEVTEKTASWAASSKPVLLDFSVLFVFSCTKKADQEIGVPRT